MHRSVSQNCCYRLSRTIGAAPAEKIEAGLGKTHGLRAISAGGPVLLREGLTRAVIPGRCEASNPESQDSPVRNCAPEVWSFGPSRNDQVRLSSPDVGEERVDFRTQHVG